MSSTVEPSLETATSQSWLERGMTRLRARLDGTAHRALLAVTDQAVVSGTRFLTTAIVGRICGPQELGNYALAFSLYILAASTQEALVSMPFTFFNNRIQGDDRRRFAGSSLTHSAAWASICAVSLAVAALVLFAFGLGPAGFAPVIGVLSISLPLAFLVEFARRYSLARLDLPAALVVDVTMMVAQLGSLGLLALTGTLSAASAFACVAAAAAVTALMWGLRTRRQFIVARSQVWADAVHNWRFSRWIVASQIWFMGRIAIMPWIVAGMLDRSATGAYVACETIVMLANPIMLAAHNLLGPQSARAYAEGGTQQLRRLIFRATVVMGLGSALLTAILLVVGETAMVLLLGETYSGHRAVLTLLTLTLAVEGIGMASTNGMCAIEQARVNLVSIIAGTIATVVLSFALIPMWGLVAAAFASLMGRAVTSALTLIMFDRMTRKGAQAEATP